MRNLTKFEAFQVSASGRNWVAPQTQWICDGYYCSSLTTPGYYVETSLWQDITYLCWTILETMFYLVLVDELVNDSYDYINP